MDEGIRQRTRMDKREKPLTGMKTVSLLFTEKKIQK
jgi:hypothetical protein